MMAVSTGTLFLLAALFSPKHGVLVKWVRRHFLSFRILCDDIVAMLYRCEERDAPKPTRNVLAETLFASPWTLSAALSVLGRRGEIVAHDMLQLTTKGKKRGRQLVRSHRLWEQYLVVETSTQADRIHDKAERFEHFTDRPLRDRLDRVTDAPATDPHGRPIPGEES